MIIIGTITTPLYKIDMSHHLNEEYDLAEYLLIFIFNPFS